VAKVTGSFSYCKKLWGRYRHLDGHASEYPAPPNGLEAMDTVQWLDNPCLEEPKEIKLLGTWKVIVAGKPYYIKNRVVFR
jgi:hypothetical protein